MSEKANKGAAQSATAKAKPNKGQDEVMHEITSPDGTEVISVTQREWRETYRDLGYTRDADDVTPEEDEEGA